MTAKKKPTASAKSTKKATKKAAKKTTKKTAKKKTVTPRPDEMSEEVLAFITAIDDYKRIHQRPFPNWSEVLEIVKSLGYERSAS